MLCINQQTNKMKQVKKLFGIIAVTGFLVCSVPVDAQAQGTGTDATTTTTAGDTDDDGNDDSGQ